MQNEITTKTSLLNESGNLVQKGWGRSLLLDYHRKNVHAAKILLKEWDYYAVLNDAFGIAVTIAVVTFFDFVLAKEWTKQVMVPFPMGRFHMPESSVTGNVSFEKAGFKMKFTKRFTQRNLDIEIADFYEGEALKASISLTEESRDSLMIATPFHKSRRFYYNHKINGMPAKGRLTIGDKTYDFGDNKSFGVLDWGRGVWTYHNTWYWGSASGEVDGHRMGFNIGYGFGDTSSASENIVYYDGIGHKLDQVTFHIPEDSFLKPWKFTSNDGRFELDFTPILDRNSNTKVLILQSDQHQVFGWFSGKVVLDGGQEVRIERLLGFAEKVMNKW